jgi:hypothetical protein
MGPDDKTIEGGDQVTGLKLRIGSSFGNTADTVTPPVSQKWNEMFIVHFSQAAIGLQPLVPEWSV